jgi:protein involved in polysaccharide export with SLBB domain
VEQVVAALEIAPDDTKKAIRVRYAGPGLAESFQFLQAWGQEVSRVLEQRDSEAAEARGKLLKEKLRSVDQAVADLGRELSARSRDDSAGDGTSPFDLLRKSKELDEKTGSAKARLAVTDQQLENLRKEAAKCSPALVAAREELNRALARYTDQHPKVRELRATIADLERAATADPAAQSPDLSSMTSPAAVALQSQMLTLQNERIGLAKELETMERARTEIGRQIPAAATNTVKGAELERRFEVLSRERLALVTALEAHALDGPGTRPGRKMVGSPYQERQAGDRWQAHLASGGMGALAGLLGAFCLIVAADHARRRIHSTEDLSWASRLPVLACLDDIERLSAAEQETWAFRTFTRLKGRLTGSSDEALICGVISAGAAEGRSTVARLLAAAASRQGYRGVVVGAPAESGPPEQDRTDEPASAEEEEMALVPARISEAMRSELPARSEARSGKLSLTLDLRKQWREALAQAGSQERLVLIADLPPTSSPQGVLLAEGVPNLIWVSGRGKASIPETSTGIGLLKDTRCNLVGAIMNTVPRHPRRKRMAPRRAAGLLAWLTLPCLLLAQTDGGPPAAPANSPSNAPGGLSFSSKPKRLEPWQERLTLGPSDVLNISLHGQADSLRDGLIVGPDGRISYMEARDVPAAGLTIDELRSRLEEVLAKYHRTPRVVIYPASFQSKKYYVLGNVNGRGAYPLDRPTTVVEAVATARGFAAQERVGAAAPAVAGVAGAERAGLAPADFSRSFLMRSKGDGGFAPTPVDFEALFLRGDLKQNVLLAPEDYLFFAPLGIQEIYVFGQVARPGILAYTKESSVFSAIVSSGGFTTRANKSSVLVVRGSLTKPVGTIINVNHILSARAPDFPLQNRDIIYVSERATARLEEMVEAAVTAFVRSMAIGAAGEYINPVINQPIF